MRTRGVTLIELLVSMAILGIVLTVALNALMGFQRLVEVANLKRVANTHVRQAARYLERDLRLLGYGLEPAMALDFTVYGGQGGYCGGAPGADVTASACPARRDRIDGPDELVFYARNPEYWGADLGSAPEGKAWSLTAADASSVTLAAHGGEYFGRGQILQLVCSGGTSNVYVRVSASRVVSAAGPVALSIEAERPGDPFTQDPAPFVALCGGMARVFQVDRFRYYVDPAVVLGDGSAASFLMLDRGVDRNNDNTIDGRDLIPVAQGIVDLQVSYLRPEPGLVEVGATRGTPISWCNAGARPVTGPVGCADGLRVVQFNAGTGAGDYPSFTYLSAAAGGLRSGPDAGNVASVRVALVAKSLKSTASLESHPLLLNRSELPDSEVNQPAVYATTELTVVTPNMLARGLTFL